MSRKLMYQPDGWLFIRDNDDIYLSGFLPKIRGIMVNGKRPKRVDIFYSDRVLDYRDVPKYINHIHNIVHPALEPGSDFEYFEDLVIALKEFEVQEKKLFDTQHGYRKDSEKYAEQVSKYGTA